MAGILILQWPSLGVHLVQLNRSSFGTSRSLVPALQRPALTLCSQVSTEEGSVHILQEHQALLRGHTQQVIEPVI